MKMVLREHKYDKKKHGYSNIQWKKSQDASLYVICIPCRCACDRSQENISGFEDGFHVVALWGDFRFLSYTFIFWNFFLDLFLFYVYDAFLYVQMCITCVSGAYSGQKAVLDALELELQVVMIHHMGAGY